MTPYPDSFPTESIASLITMIRDKNVDKQAMALAIWNLQGYAQSKLITNASFRFSASSNPNPSDEDALEALTTLQNNETIKAASGPELIQNNPVFSVALSILLKWVLNKAMAL